MTDSHNGNIALQWTSTFFSELTARGIKHVIISPGSRSTPLTLAAANNQTLQQHVILDERSAAFTALGIGKATNVPAVLICTSGTALANYYPAVIEARQSGIPLIMATADRPPHLRATGANQAIDQLKIFGDYPVFFHEVGEPAADKQDLNRLKLLAQQAFTLSREKRGPVHLNFPFRKPLEPTREMLNKANSDSTSSLAFVEKEPVDQTTLSLGSSLQNKLSSAQKPAIIVGPLAPGDDTQSIKELSETLNAPVLTESTIDSRNTIIGFPAFLRNDQTLAQLAPDLLIRFGFQPTSKSLTVALQKWVPKHHLHFSSTESWQDATASQAQRISWKGQSLDFQYIEPANNSSWLEEWKTVAKVFGRHRRKTIAQSTKLTDGNVYHHLTPMLSDEHFAMVSNSFPARDINLFSRVSDTPIFLNRGASGIDGTSSTALGLSLGLEKPGLLFTGDLAFLHDTNALLNHNKLQHPLTVVVINNSGGSIFRMLPIYQHKQHFKPYFETPQDVDISKLVSAYNIPYQKITSLSQLNDLNQTSLFPQQQGLSIIECQTDADASMQLRKKLWDF